MTNKRIRSALAAVLAIAMLWAVPATPQTTPDGKFKVLGMTLWVIMTRPAEGAERSQDALDAHMAHQFRLEKEGIMFGAGPFSDADGNPQGGMIIIRAADKEEAIRIADSDPMHARGLRTYTLHKWSLNEGHIDISVDYSKGTFTLR